MERKSVLTVEEDRVEITGVTKVISYNERELLVETGAKKLCILGEGLTCDKLDIENGVVVARGRTRLAKYVDNTGILKKLVK